MAKHKSAVPRPSMRFITNLSALPRRPTPSSALLAILASLVGSANPFPVACSELAAPSLSFLCPSLQPRAETDAQDFPVPPQTSPSSSSDPSPSRALLTDCPTLPSDRYTLRKLAPGYTQGPDGRWRKLSAWSLDGSNICVVRGIIDSYLRFRLLIFPPRVSVVTFLPLLEPNLKMT